MKKPIVFFDIESTGTDVAKDRIVQFAALKVFLSDDWKSKEPEQELKFYVNPGIQIPAEVTEIHGITDEMVKDQPMMNIQGPKIQAFIDGCDLCAFNGKRFDIPILAKELSRCGITFSLKDRKVIDVFVLYKILHPQSLAAAHKTYVGEDLDGAHDAMNDVVGTFKVLQGMMHSGVVPGDISEMIKFQQNGEEFDSTVDFAGKFIRNKEGVILLNFGKHKGQPAADNISFLNWMLGKDFTRDTRDWCEELLAQNYGIDQDDIF